MLLFSSNCRDGSKASSGHLSEVGSSAQRKGAARPDFLLLCAPDLDPDVLLPGMPFPPCKDSHLERRSEVSAVSALNFVLSIKWTAI